MNCSKVILALWLGTAAWGQVRLVQPPAPPPAATSPKAVPAAPHATSSSPRQPSASGRVHSRPVRRAYPARHVSRGTQVASKDGTERPRGQRDPFVSPIMDRARTPIACVGTGKQCLEIGEVSLHGVVRGPAGYIAVVVNGDHTYFLHEKDPLANGQVERITKDSIVLRERYYDDTGRPVTREVTRKLGASTV